MISPTAQMIAADLPLAGAPLLRKEVALATDHGAVARATLDVTALGVVEAFVAGEAVSDEVLSPGWSAYEWRLRYRTHDVTHRVRAAGMQFVIGLALGRGWAVGRLGFTQESNLYADEPAALAQLRIEYADGHVQEVATDDTWQAGPSAVVANDLYDGETVDARLRSDAWLAPDAQLDAWSGVHVIPFDAKRLVPYASPVVRRQEELPPVEIAASGSGRTLVDFGQNLVGWVRLRAHGPAGTVITVRHAEVLEQGELGVRPLRTAAATDRFILSGGDDVFEPTFTSHGFRYCDVDGYPGTLTPDALTAIVVHTDLERIGTFACSDASVARLHRNVVWSIKGNVLDVPTDCPQRDERLGWTGDLAVVAPTAAYLYDVSSFIDDWLADLAVEQAAAGGRVPYVVPDVLKITGIPGDLFDPVESTGVWADVAAWVPWALWQAYGDRTALARHLPVMLAHVRHVEGLLSPRALWEAGFQFGDWLDPDAPPDVPDRAKADRHVVATAAFYRSIVMTGAAAREVGELEAAEEVEALGERVRAAFTTHYVAADGRVQSDCQTVYALAIWFGLLDGGQLVAAGDRLAELVVAAQHRISTGFAGTPFVLDALTATGHLDVAYRMLLQPEVPGWMYQVHMGATTMWERWDSMLPDGSVNPGEMTSFNHYAFGSVADWLHRVVLGIAPAQPGYATVLVAPRPGGGISSACGSLRTPHGTVSVAWQIEPDGGLQVEVDVPEGVDALVRLPGQADTHQVGGSAVHRAALG